MKYYLTAVKHIKDGAEARECLGIEDILAARATMYSKQASAMNDPNCDYAFAAVKNHLGQDVVPAIAFERPHETPDEA